MLTDGKQGPANFNDNTLETVLTSFYLVGWSFKSDLQVKYVEPFILDLYKTAINMYGLPELQDTPLIYFILMHVEN